MNTLTLSLMLITGLISYFGIQDKAFFHKYKFEVHAIEQRKEYIRFFSSGFLHADWLHFALNMWVLYLFAPIVIHFFGAIDFLLIYFGAMFLGNASSLYIYKNVPFYSAIGASGAVSGILFSAIALHPKMTMSVFFIPMPGFIFGLLYFAYSVYMMLNPKKWDNIGHSAHLGGAIFGIVYAFIANPQPFIQNISYIGIMSLPLICLAYIIFSKRNSISKNIF